MTANLLVHQVSFFDSAFANDVAKSNPAAFANLHGIATVRSL